MGKFLRDFESPWRPGTYHHPTQPPLTGELIRVATIDAHPLFRRGIEAAIRNSNIVIVDEGATTEDGLRILADKDTDILVIDMIAPSIDFSVLASAAVQCQIHIVVLVASTADDQHNLVRALRGGARGFVLKGACLEDLVTAIETVHRNEPWIDCRIANRMIFENWRNLTAGFPATNGHGLTADERRLLECVSRGRTNSEIASSLGISIAATKHRVFQLFQKLGVHTRMQAVIKHRQMHGDSTQPATR